MTMTPDTKPELEQTPGTNLEVINWREESIKLKEYAEARVIKGLDDLKLANDDLTLISRLKKAMEERRKQQVRPLNDEVKVINDIYKVLMEPVEKAETITKMKMLAFDAEQRRLRQAQEEVNRLRMEAAQKEAAMNQGEISEPVNLVEVIPEAPHKISTDMGSTNTVKVRKWKLVDISKVPPELLLVDAGRVTKLVKAGIGSIAGIEIYEELTIATRAR